MLEQTVPSGMLTCRSLKCAQALPRPLELLMDVKTAKKRNRKAKEPRKHDAVWQCSGNVCTTRRAAEEEHVAVAAMSVCADDR